jgi:hypothetical protein
MKIFILIVIIFSCIQLQAQETKNTIVLSGVLAHYEQNSKYGSAKAILGYYHYPVDPGIEVLYLRNLNKNISLGTGICFQRGRTSDFIINPDRFNFDEVSIPVLLSSRYKFHERNGLLITTGLYGGKTILRKAEFIDNGNAWHEHRDFNIGWYSDDVVFLDIYFGAGYSYSVSQNRIISIMPFVKYRANTVWLNDFQEKLHYGVKLSYSINF